MRSALPKVLHPICGRPMILWPLLAARDAGAGRVIVVDNPKRRLAEHLPDGVEIAIQEEPRGTGDAVAAAAELIDADAPRARHQRRHAADHRARRSPRSSPPTRSRGRRHDGARWSSRTRRGYGRVVRGADGGVERVVGDQGGGRRDRPRSSPSARSTPACTLFDGGALARARSSGSTPTTPRASTTCPTWCPPCSPPGRRVQAHPLPTPTSRSASTTASTSRTSRALAQQRIHRAHQRAGVTIVDPASTHDRRRRRRSAATRVIEPATCLQGATRDRRARRDRPAHDR